MFPLFAVLSSLVAASQASCGYRTSFVPSLTLPAFDYGNVRGPLNWHNLDPAYYLCGNGTHQAPTIISSNSTPTVPPGSVKVKIPISTVIFENLGTTVEVPMNGTFTALNTTYALKQFHFHSPSEHRIDGLQYALEMHFVFQTPSNATAVLAFFFELKPYASAPVVDILAGAVGAIPTPGDETTISNLDFSSFISTLVEPSTFYYLQESLTTPPCSEGVAWYLSTKPVPLGVDRWNSLHAILKYNARFTQNTLGSTNILQVGAGNLTSCS